MVTRIFDIYEERWGEVPKLKAELLGLANNPDETEREQLHLGIKALLRQKPFDINFCNEQNIDRRNLSFVCAAENAKYHVDNFVKLPEKEAAFMIAPVLGVIATVARTNGENLRLITYASFTIGLIGGIHELSYHSINR